MSLLIFYGLASENPGLHIAQLEEAFSSDEVAMLQVFPSSLRDCAEDWFYSFSLGSIHTWGEMITYFLNKFTPIYETHMLLQDLSNFNQQDDESFSQCWERFKCSIFSWSSFNCELGSLLAIFCHGLNSKTCQFDLFSDEEFLSKTPAKSWDYLEELAQKPQFCELTEIEIEPLVRNDPLENSLTIEEMDAEMHYLISLFPLEDVHNGESLCPTSEAVPPIALLSTLPPSTPIESPPQELEKVEIIDFLGEKTFEANVTCTSIESPPPQELERVELIDFLGVDNYDCVYNPFLLNLVNTLKMNLVRIMHLVELDFLKRLLLSLYSKYLILWHGRVQFLTEGLKWGDMLVLLVFRSTSNVWISRKGGAWHYFYF